MDTKLILGITLIIFVILYIIYYFIIQTLLKSIHNKNIPMYCIFIPQREKYIKNFFNDYGLKINFVPAVYKDNINIEQMIKDNKLSKNMLRYSNPESRIGCYLSHVKSMKEFLKTDKERCVIFEDDITTSYSKVNLLYKFNNILGNIPNDCDLLYIGYCFEQCDKVKKYNEYFSIGYKPLCLHTWSVNRRASEIIINESNYINDTIDEILLNINFKVYLSNYDLFYQNRDEIISLLGNNNKLTLCA